MGLNHIYLGPHYGQAKRDPCAAPTLEQRYTVINSIDAEANSVCKAFFAKKLKQPDLDKLVTLNPRGIRIAIETAIAFAAGDDRRILLPDDIKARDAKPSFRAGFM